MNEELCRASSSRSNRLSFAAPQHGQRPRHLHPATQLDTARAALRPSGSSPIQTLTYDSAAKPTEYKLARPRPNKASSLPFRLLDSPIQTRVHARGHSKNDSRLSRQGMKEGKWGVDYALHAFLDKCTLHPPPSPSTSSQCSLVHCFISRSLLVFHHVPHSVSQCFPCVHWRK